MKKDLRLTSADAAAGLEANMQSGVLGTHLQILASPKIAQRAVEKHDLLNLESLQQQLKGPAGLRSLMDSVLAKEERQFTEEELQGAAVSYILRNLGVRRGGLDAARDAQVVSVTLDHYASQEDCAKILAAVVDCYQDFLGVLAARMGQETKLAMTKAKENLEDELQAKESQREQFLVDSPLIWSNGVAMNPHQSHAAKLETELSDLEIRRASATARLVSVQAALQDETEDSLALFALIDPADMDRLSVLLNIERGYLPASAAAEFGKLVDLKVELERKQAIYAASHPQVRQLQKTITELESYLVENSRSLESLRDDDGIDPRRIAEVYARLLQEDISDIDSRVAVVAKLTNEQLQKAKSLSSYELEYLQITRRLDRKQELYDSIVDRLREVDITKDFSGFLTEDISPISDGVLVWPRSLFVAAFCGVFGVFAGWSLSLFAEWADSSFRSRFDIETDLEVPLLAQVRIQRFRRPNMSGKKKRRTVHESVATIYSPASPFAESFRSLRTALICRSEAWDQPVLQVTSPVAGDGKSTVTANLAVAMANAGKNVLLVDCDLRNPTVHKLFGISNHAGLTDILTQREPGEVRVQTEIPNLSIIPSGRLSSGCSELLVSVRFQEFLSEVRGNFDFVFLDSPPVFGTSDSLAMAGQIDGTLLVIRLARHKVRQLARRAKDELLKHGGRVIGLVSNGELRESLTDEYQYYAPHLRVVAADGNRNRERESPNVASRHAN